MRRMMVAIAAVLGCSGDGATKPPVAAPSDSAGAGAVAAPADADAERKARRQAWLDEVAGYVAAPDTIPRWSDPAGRAKLEALTSERAWLDIDIDRDDMAQALAFFPALKAMSLHLTRRRANDENALLMLYMDDVNRAFFAAGERKLAQYPPGDPAQQPRRDGFETMRLAAAMNLAGLLDAVDQTSPEIRARAMARLDDPATYAGLSRESLQFFDVTLDAEIGRAGVGVRRTALTRIRETAAKVREAMPPATPTKIYEPLPHFTALGTQTIVSRAGKFAVTAGPGAMMWTVPPGAGRTAPMHQMRWLNDGETFEVTCTVDFDEAHVIEVFVGAGGKEVTGPGPGRWIATTQGGREARIRIVKLGAHVCVAGVEAPAGRKTPAQMEALLGSLEAR